MNSIQRQLLLWLLLVILLAVSTAGVAIYYSARNEANRLFDYQLRGTAVSLPAHLNPEAIYPHEELEEEDIVIQVWTPQDKLIYSSNPKLSLPRYKQQGFQTIHAFDEDWRLYIENRRMNFIQIAQPQSARDALAASLAIRSLAPLFILIPVMLLLAALVVRRNLAPLKDIARTLAKRSPTDLQALPIRGLPQELQTIVHALNGWLNRLEQTLSAQRNFIADAAHELRSPLTALKLQLQLTERAKTESQRLTSFTRLHERINRAIHLVEQLLTLARHETPLDAINGTTVALGNLLQTIGNDYSVTTDSKHIQLLTLVPEPDILIQGDPHGLTLLLKNLLDNAFNHTPAGGSILLQVERKQGQVLLRVTDSGCGIAAEDRQRVFDRFYRCPGDSTPGTGLGLAIAQNIAGQHQASIQLADNPNGQGLQVTVAFPASQPNLNLTKN